MNCTVPTGVVVPESSLTVAVIVIAVLTTGVEVEDVNDVVVPVGDVDALNASTKFAASTDPHPLARS
jgi:hypothetical protein